MILRAALLIALAGPALAAPDYGRLEIFAAPPFVFPLQIRTDADHDTLVTLRDAVTGEVALTALAKGGAFFRVLVPKGTFTVSFLEGRGWREGGFTDPGAASRYPAPLTFAVEGLGRKSGHLLDLRGDGPPRGRPLGLCQTASVDPDYQRALRFADRLPPGDPTLDDLTAPLEFRKRTCD